MATGNLFGKTLSLDGDPYSIIGVLPPTVGLGTVDLWIPAGASDRVDGHRRGRPVLRGGARADTGVRERHTQPAAHERPQQVLGEGQAADPAVTRA